MRTLGILSNNQTSLYFDTTKNLVEGEGVIAALVEKEQQVGMWLYITELEFKLCTLCVNTFESVLELCPILPLRCETC